MLLAQANVLTSQELAKSKHQTFGSTAKCQQTVTALDGHILKLTL